jgi:hypothetical protein
MLSVSSPRDIHDDNVNVVRSLMHLTSERPDHVIAILHCSRYDFRAQNLFSITLEKGFPDISRPFNAIEA